MDMILNSLYGVPIKLLLENTEHKQFFTEAEFNKNYGKIMLLSYYRENLENKLKTIKKLEDKIKMLENKK